MVALLVLGLTGCAFAVSATSGSTQVQRKHVWADAALTSAAGFGCAIAAIAWKDPDAFAPTQGDASSWRSPGDRLSAQSTGAAWTPAACIVAVAFLASTIYGQVTAPADPDLDARIAGAMATVATGMSAAQQSTQRASYAATTEAAVRRHRDCYSDFGCESGFECVKPRYSTEGTCMRAVDEAGAQVFDAPDPASVGPNLSSDFDCERDGCPAAFRCNVPTGVCEK